MIEFNNVSFSYKNKPIFKDFNLKINEGERICLFAPSGFGKTTLLRLIMGLEKPLSGSVDGIENISISASFQEDRLIPQKTVLENCELFCYSEEAREILKSLNLENAVGLYPKELSGGMARRVSIARALSKRSDIYIFDEPFNGIDKENIKKTAELIVNKTMGKTFIVVSHNLYEAELLKAAILKLGIC